MIAMSGQTNFSGANALLDAFSSSPAAARSFSPMTEHNPKRLSKFNHPGWGGFCELLGDDGIVSEAQQRKLNSLWNDDNVRWLLLCIKWGMLTSPL